MPSEKIVCTDNDKEKIAFLSWKKKDPPIPPPLQKENGPFLRFS